MNMNTNANTNMNRMKCLVERWGDMEWTDGSKKCDANAGVVLVSSRYFAAIISGCLCYFWWQLSNDHVLK